LERNAATLLGAQSPAMFYDFMVSRMKHMKSLIRHPEAPSLQTGLPDY